MKKLFYLFCLTIFYNCSVQKFSEIKNGDLLFIQAKEENLSGAISRVTKKNNAISYDHIAIIEREKDQIYVLHAAPEVGSVKEIINTFLKKYNKNMIDLYRLKPEFQNSIKPAIVQANILIGKPYNTSYILNDNSYYCSDFIERSFRKNNIFQLKPMTFIDPKTGKTDEFWDNFYKKLDLKVPEGEPGCNPNGLSQSNKIEKIKRLQ